MTSFTTAATRPSGSPVGRAPGRPPASDGAATRRRVLSVARVAFAELGYMGTTYRELRLRTGLTTASLYHYFPSKLDLYRAVQDDVIELMYDRYMLPALEGCVTLMDHVETFLRVAHQMAVDDPSISVFVLSSRIDARRHPEVAALGHEYVQRRASLFGRFADAGIASGELQAADREVFIDTFDTLSAGLVVATANMERYEHALEGIRRFVAGSLVKPLRKRAR